MRRGLRTHMRTYRYDTSCTRWPHGMGAGGSAECANGTLEAFEKVRWRSVEGWRCAALFVACG